MELSGLRALKSKPLAVRAWKDGGVRVEKLIELPSEAAKGRRACRVLGQAGDTQRRKTCVADDEPQLVKRTVWLASVYGRYGYRRITAPLRAEDGCRHGSSGSE